MNFFAFRDRIGLAQEPKEVHYKVLLKCKDEEEAIHQATKRLGAKSRVYAYTDYYDDRTFRLVY